MTPKISDCCKYNPQMIGELDSEDLEICPNCFDPCEYKTEDEIEAETDLWINSDELPNEE